MSRRGFTVVELMVAVAIIVILVSFLLPSLSKVRESSRKIGCLGQLEEMANANAAWAITHNGRWVVGKPIYLTSGIYAVWHRNTTGVPATFLTDPDYGAYCAQGALAKNDYIDGRVMYCPSWEHPFTQYETSSAGAGGGWFDDPADLPAAQEWMQTSYHYNSHMDTGAGYRSVRSADPAGTPIMADAFADPSRGVGWHHETGYNVAYMDGSVAWYEDKTHEIRDYNGGSPYFSGAAEHGLQALVWADYFSR